MPAPVGYVNVGKGKAKERDPIKAPMVRQCFELYATGRYHLVALVAEMKKRGLRGRKSQIITFHGMSQILNNRFYTGLIKIKKTGDTYIGAHKAIISQEPFNHVHRTRHGNITPTYLRHDYQCCRTLTCR